MLVAVFACLTLGFDPASYGQTVDVERITLAEALSRFQSSNLELRLGRLRLAEARVRSRHAAPFPNPSLEVSHEPLSDGEANIWESYATVSQRVMWPRVRRARIDVAEWNANATQAEYAEDSLTLAFEVKRAFVRAWASEQRATVLEEVGTIFRQADRSLTAMVAEGEASGLDLRRIRIELTQLETQLANAGLAILRTRRELTNLLGGDLSQLLLVPASLTDPPIREVAIAEALDWAMQRRPAARAARARRSQVEAQLMLSSRERWPEPAIQGGYKRQSDGFQGAYVALSTAIPLFDRNRREIEVQRSRLTAAETRRLIVERDIESDVQQAFANYVTALDLRRLAGPGLLEESETLLGAAGTAYLEGEVGLTVLLDAARTYRDARISMLEIQAGLFTAYFDLARACGGVVPE